MILNLEELSSIRFNGILCVFSNFLRNLYYLLFSFKLIREISETIIKFNESFQKPKRPYQPYPHILSLNTVVFFK